MIQSGDGSEPRSSENLEVRCADVFFEHRSNGSKAHAYSGPAGFGGKARRCMHFEVCIP